MQSTLFSFPCRQLMSISQPRKYSAACSSQSHTHSNPNPDDSGKYKCGARKEMTALEKHAAFFDRNNDGVIYPWETFEGVVAIGFNPILAFFTVIPTNMALSFQTRPWQLPDPYFPIEVKNIDKAQHGSHTGVYNKGRIAAYVEWETLYVLFKNKKGKLEKATVRAFYDGTLFEKVEMDHKKKLEDA